MIGVDGYKPKGLNSFALVGQPYHAGIANGTTGQLRSGFVSLVEPAAGSGTSADSDGDGLPDVWESIYGFDPLLVDSSSDLDGDGLNELKEFQKGTHPNLADTDGDGLSDREETENYDTDPTLVDTDGDGYEDAEELSGGYSPTDDSEYPGWNVVVVNYVDALNAQASGGGRATATGFISYSLTGTFAAPPMVGNAGFSSLHGFIYLANPPTGDPREVDSDGDGLPDVWELANGANPVLVDAGEDGDEDGLSNLQEFDAGTYPRNSDSDEDGLSDGEEILGYSTNPLLVDTDGDGYEDGEEVSAMRASPSDANSIPAYANPKTIFLLVVVFQPQVDL